MAAVRGYEWPDEEIDRLRQVVEKALAMVDKLDSLPLRDVEPAIQYRMF